VTREEHRRWRLYLRGLRETCPPDASVIVRRVDLSCDGKCTWTGKRYVVLIKRTIDYWRATDSLCHEWAHALSWTADGPNEHGPEWGVAYARVYRVMLAISADWEGM